MRVLIGLGEFVIKLLMNEWRDELQVLGMQIITTKIFKTFLNNIWNK